MLLPSYPFYCTSTDLWHNLTKISPYKTVSDKYNLTYYHRLMEDNDIVRNIVTMTTMGIPSM
jgi:hypothetical protein